jgi:hypothetical protein
MLDELNGEESTVQIVTNPSFGRIPSKTEDPNIFLNNQYKNQDKKQTFNKKMKTMSGNIFQNTDVVTLEFNNYRKYIDIVFSLLYNRYGTLGSRR